MAYLVYFDEVKFDPPNQKTYIVGGIAIHVGVATTIEQKLHDLAEGYFDSHLLDVETEFHGKEIYNGKNNYKAHDFVKRLDLLKALAKILDDGPLDKIYARIHPENIKLSNRPPKEIAFQYFVEQADAFLKERNSFGLLFGDRDEEVVNEAIRSVHRYKRSATEWASGRRIERIIDTPYFAQSHHSRLVQLADIYVYLLQFSLNQGEASANRRSFREYLLEHTDITQYTRKRDWPVW